MEFRGQGPGDAAGGAAAAAAGFIPMMKPEAGFFAFIVPAME